MTAAIGSPLLASTTASVTGTAGTARDKLSSVAKQFEGIFLRQMLAAARKTSFGGEDSLMGGQGMDTFRQMQDERFADIAADTGAFGLAKMIETHLAKFVQAETGDAEAATQQDTTPKAIGANGI